MEAVIQNGLSDCNSFISSLDSLEKRLNEQLLFLDEQHALDHEKCEIQCANLRAECIQLESQTRTVVNNLLNEEAMTVKLRTEQTEVNQDVINLKSEENDLEYEIQVLENELERLRTHLEPRKDVVLYRFNAYRAVAMPGNVFDNILGFLDTRQLFLIENVCKQWHDTISTWPAWAATKQYQPKPTEFDVSEMVRQSFPRFLMYIELDQKKSLWNITVEGKVEGDNSPVSGNPSNTVVMDINQQNSNMIKEYMVCDTILKTNQKLAQIKVDMSRHHQRLSNDESIKKGYKIQTDAVSAEIQELIRKNHHLETQLQSDQHTLNYLQLRVTQLTQEYTDLSNIPTRIKDQQRSKEVAVEETVESLKAKELSEKQAEIAKIKKEKEVLAREIRKAEAKLKEATAKRDTSKKKYMEIKEQLAVMLL